MSDISTALKSLKGVIGTIGIPEINQSVSNLESELASAKGGNQFKNIAQSATGSGAEGFFSSKSGSLLKQANMAIELFKKIGNTYPDLKTFLEKESPTDSDVNNIKSILTKEVNSIFNRLMQFGGVRTKPYAGLEPQTVIDQITRNLGMNKESKQLPPISVIREQATPTSTDAEQSNPSPPVPTEDSKQNNPDADAFAGIDLSNLNKSMSALYNYAKSAGGSTPSSSSAPAQNSDKTQNNMGTTGTQDAADGSGSGNMVDQNIAKDIASKLNSKPDQITKVITGLNNAGYKVVKK